MSEGKVKKLRLKKEGQGQSYCKLRWTLWILFFMEWGAFEQL